MMSKREAGQAMRDEKVFTLVDELLAEQQTLSAVERFSQLHDRDQVPALAGHYQALLPVAKPGPGEQYAFEVNLDACTGCKACVSACHSLNGLDDDEAWRDVGSLIGGSRNDAYQQTVTTACHHCADPACMNGCPVGAYEKEADTGVVKHLDDQCIGCQYCVLKCPYDVPKYNERLGIVRKCDMCVGRLREGEAPACVQACPTSAISIRVVKLESMTFTSGQSLVPGAFDSSYTKPTSAYVTSKAMPKNARPADAGSQRLEHAHWPLVVMLILTQMSVGMFAVAGGLMPWQTGLSWSHVVYVATALLMAGLIVSVLHLGRPLGAWRFFLGLRTSWMSREILAFSLLAGSASIASVAVFFHSLALPAVIATALLGICAVYTSVMIYADTRRPFWNFPVTNVKFYGTTLLLGFSACSLVTGSKGLAVATLVVRAVLYAWGQHITRKAINDDDCAWHMSARVTKEALWKVSEAREGAFLLATILTVPVLASEGPLMIACGAAMFLITAVGQVLDRYTFFVASMGLRMTGGNKE